ncbi:hypothetical protein [Streptomyces sp. ALI-76-A]|uniref:hypothetical protein n=1 Tax=Streptomyces sp. ALI-76-A TaxID=3025736 RepID=UPI00256EAB15|nr:hypothetical protein [Streptomyces sp. ALI-76-A]MDL5201610.1 hypothetical protein [Streptomyces sp. ALI-76-A]
MTAEHDGHDGRAGMDALMAAIIDEPLSDAARADAGFMAEHRSAESDLALLREQLGVIGHVLGEPPPPAHAPEPVLVRPSRTRRRTLHLAFGTVAVTAVAAVLSGMAWLLTQASGDAGVMSDGADSGAAKQEAGGDAFGSPQYLACSRLLAEGRASAVERIPGTETLRVTVRVTRYYLPEPPPKNAEEVTYMADSALVADLSAGDQVLLRIARGDSRPDHWIVGEREIAPERSRLTRSLAESRGLTCE